MFLKFLGLKKHAGKSYPTVIEELCRHFSLADLTKATNNFDQNNVTGKGFFGKVYKGYLQLDHVATAVLVKRIPSKTSTIVTLERFKNEIELLCQLRHPNLISLIGFHLDRGLHKDDNFIVFEYMPNGSLGDRLFYDWEPLSWNQRLEICIGAARGLHYLHSGAKRTIIHRDIKASNILLDENMVPKLSDFGLSLQGALFTVTKPKPIEGKPIAGTFGYMSPENAMAGILTDKCDVYSFGVVLFEVVRAKPIHEIWFKKSNVGSESSDDDIPRSILSYILSKLQAEDIDPALIGKIAPDCYAVYIDIIDRCSKEEPNERPTMGEVEVQLEHALALQQEADNAKDTSSIIQPQQEHVPISH